MTVAQAVPTPWRVFLRSLALEMEAQSGPAACATVLRSAGQRMAQLMTLPPVDSISALEMEMNALLADMEWGQVCLTLDEAERCIVLSHTGLPQVGSAGDPPGSWLAAVLEGLYEVWLRQQPGSDDSFRARIRSADDSVIIHYQRY
jgi:hypothetical protein